MYRKVKFKIATVAFFSLMSIGGFSQQTINVSSRSATINGMRFDYSIGEMTLVSTERNAGLIVTQGLLQPTSSGSGANTPTEHVTNALSDLIKVYPNPTENILFVESIENTDTDINYQLFDASGKIVMSEKVTWTSGPNKLSLDLRNYAAGAYYLMIRKPNQAGQTDNFSYKIQKTN